MTIDEIVAYLAESELPTLIVEGRSDMRFFRYMEDLMFENKINIFPVGGRSALFEIYKQREKFNGLPIAFLADSDMLLFTSTPAELSGVLFTEGYSIENDILSGGKALRLITKKKDKWARILNLLSQWFASAVRRYLLAQTIKYDHHPLKILDFKKEVFSKLAQLVLLPDEQLCADSKKVVQSPHVHLRGHALHHALLHFLIVTNQKHNCEADVLLMYDVVAYDSNQSLIRLADRIRNAVFPPNL